MPGELDYSAIGQANVFVVGQSAWHREGTLLAKAPRYETALEVAGLDYKVVKVPAYRASTVPRGGHIRSDNAFLTVRTDRDTELGAVGSQYEPLQNREAFEMIRPLVDTGVLELETGGVLREGADAWLLGRFDIARFGPLVREVFTDEIVPYILVANNHSGRRSARIAETPIRVVCANTLDLADQSMARGSGRSVTVRHTRGATTRMIEATEELLSAIIERYEELAQQYQLLKDTTLEPTQFDVLVLDPVSPDPRRDPDWRPVNPQAEAALERTLRRRTELRRLWTDGAGHNGDLSAWEAYNGLVQAVDHDASLFPVRVDRTESLLDGRLRDVKRECKLRLLKHAALVGANGK